MQKKTTSTGVEHFPFNPTQFLPESGVMGLWKMLKGYRLTYLIATISLFIAMSSKTSTYLLLRYFIDHILKPGAPAYWYPIIGGGFVALALIQGATTFLSGTLTAKTSEGIIRKLRNHLFDHTQSLSLTYHATTNTGELIQRSTSDVETIRKFYSEQAISLGRVFLLFSINFVAIANINLKLALISVVVVPVIVVISALFFSQIAKRYRAFQEQEAALSSVLQESLSGIRVVKAFGRESYEEKKFDRENQEKYLRGKKLILIHSAFWPITDILCGLQLLTGYVVGGFMTINGAISIGSYVAFSGLIVWIIFPMRMLGRLIVEISKVKVSYRRIMEILKEKPENIFRGKEKEEKEIRGEIIFENVSFYYDKKTPALKNINLRCNPGEIVALIGSAGSGKTTLVNLLPRFYEYSSGRILLDREELTNYSKEFLRRIIGYVEQEPFLFSLTIAENIAYGVKREVSIDEIVKAAKAAAIHESILEFPRGYNTIVGERGVTLSGGQKQRIAIARVILKNPKILILDDSTSSVDTETEEKIWEALKNLIKGRTTFIIAHRVQTLMRADTICVLERGEIIQQGTHKQLINQDGMYKKIYELQSKISLELKKEISKWR